MNREIKFRAWDKRINKMLYSEADYDQYARGSRLYDKDSIIDEYFAQECYPFYEIEGIFTYFQTIAKSENFVLMQYTGLKDNNDVEIFEGDIVEYKIYGAVETNVVIYEEWDCSFFPLSCGNHHENSPEDIKVIGNIYENPELLRNPE
jgi:uncharacterized phage protein (TIGR01671 family)